jgi:hypothetical protein
MTLSGAYWMRGSLELRLYRYWRFCVMAQEERR